ATVTELAIAPEHRDLADTQNTIMQFEAVCPFSPERILPNAELSPRLAQMLDSGRAVGPDSYGRALAPASPARAALLPLLVACARTGPWVFWRGRSSSRPGGPGGSAKRARRHRGSHLQQDVDTARRPLRDPAGALGRQWLADRRSARRADRR